MWLAACSASPHLCWQTSSLPLITWQPIPTCSATWSHILIFPLVATLFYVSYLNWLDNSQATLVVNLSGKCHLSDKMLLRHLFRTVFLSLLLSSCKSHCVRWFMKYILIWKAMWNPGGLIMTEWTDTNSYLMSFVLTISAAFTKKKKKNFVQFHTVCSSPAAQWLE